MKLAIISSEGSPNTADLLRAAEGLGHEATTYALKDLAFTVEAIDAHPFFQHDTYLFRGYNRSYSLAMALAQSLRRKGKTVIDEQLVRGFIPSKFHEALIYKDAGVAHIPTYAGRTLAALQQIGFPGNYPVVVKDIDSQRGRGVRLCQNESELRTELQQNGRSIIVQEYIQMAYDVRVLCVGDVIVGAIKRESSNDDFRTNVSLGGKATPYDLSEQEAALAMHAHKSMGYDISGVDIAHNATGEPFVIETNITPEWQGFKEATGIDVAAKIIDYAIERCRSGKNV